MRSSFWQYMFVGTFSALLSIGCSTEPPQETAKEDVQLLPPMPEMDVNVQAVSNQKVVSPQIVLNQGETHYFHKTIEQSIGSGSDSRLEAVRERVELLLSLSVISEEPQFYRVQVAFHKVHYESLLGDQKIEYQSGSSAVVPPEVLPYQGLINNGFVMIISKTNQLRDIERYIEFFQNCVNNYPQSMQSMVLQNLGANAETPTERVAVALSFLDESIALLPFEKPTPGEDVFEVGKSWNRRLARKTPIPFEEKILVSIEHVSGDGATAHLTIGGEIHPMSSQGAMSPDAVRTRVLGGSVSGSCSVSLKTGLPKSCRIQRDYSLEIASLNHPAVTTRKTVVTSLEAWTPPSGQ